MTMRQARSFLVTGVGLLLLGLIAWAASDEEVAVATSTSTGIAAGQAALPPKPAMPEPAGCASTGEAAVDASAVLPATALDGQSPMAALKALKSCYYADSCGFPRGDGLDAHFAASKAITERLEALPAVGDSAQLGALAREFLSFPDGHVQAAALALAARLPPDASTVSSTVSALGDSYDAQLFRQALPVLQQWQQLGMSSGFDDMLASTLHTGGVHAAQVVAENLLPFINDGNVGRFETVLQQLQPGARQAALRRSLRDYRLLRSGG